MMGMALALSPSALAHEARILEKAAPNLASLSILARLSRSFSSASRTKSRWACASILRVRILSATIGLAERRLSNPASILRMTAELFSFRIWLNILSTASNSVTIFLCRLTRTAGTMDPRPPARIRANTRMSPRDAIWNDPGSPNAAPATIAPAVRQRDAVQTSYSLVMRRRTPSISLVSMLTLQPIPPRQKHRCQPGRAIFPASRPVSTANIPRFACKKSWILRRVCQSRR